MRLHRADACKKWIPRETFDLPFSYVGFAAPPTEWSGQAVVYQYYLFVF